MSKVYMDSEYIPVDLETLVDANGISEIRFNKKPFMNGFDDGTYYAGFATALFNAGLEEESVAEIIRDIVSASNEE